MIALLLIIIAYIVSSIVSIMYVNRAEKRVQLCDKIQSKITAMISNKRVVLVIGKYVIFDERSDSGIYFCRISRGKVSRVSAINRQITEDRLGTLIKQTPPEDIMVILKKQTPNYILIKSVGGGIFFEKISFGTVFYPDAEILDVECRDHPISIYPPKDYLFYDDLVGNGEMRKRCAAETHMRGLTRFAIVDDDCLPLSDTDYGYVKTLRKKDTCFNGMGNRFSTNIYSIDYGIGMEDERVVMRYNGMEVPLDEGGYFNPNIESIKIPERYIVHVLYNDHCSKSYRGPATLKKMEKIKKVDVKKIKKNSVLFCVEKDKMCYTYEPGSHVLPMHLHRRISHVEFSPTTQRVIIFSDIGFQHPIQTLNNSGKIGYPKHVRSLRIL